MTFTADINQIVATNSNGLMGKRPSWQRIRLGQIARIQNGFPFTSARFSRTAGVPLIRIRDIIRGATDTYYSGGYDPAFLVSRGDLLVGMDGDFNCALWSGPDGLLNQRVCRIIPDESRCSRRYLRYVLPGYLAAINANTPSVTVKHLSSRTVADIPVPLPPLEEQEALVAGLDAQVSRMESAGTALARVQASLKRYRAAVLKAACEGRLVPTEAELARQAGRPGGFETGEALLARILEERRRGWKGKGKYKEPVEPDVSRLPSLPEGWVWATVEQLSSKVQYGTSAKAGPDPRGIPVLRMGNIQEGRVVADALKYLPRESAEFPDLLLRPGDVLFNRTNSPELVGKAALYGGTPAVASFASYLIRVRTADDFRPELLVYFLNSVFGRSWVASVVSQQVGQANVNGSKLQALAVPLPPIAEQSRIVAEVERRLSLGEELGGIVADNLRRSVALRQAFLRRAFGQGHPGAPVGAATGETL